MNYGKAAVPIVAGTICILGGNALAKDTSVEIEEKDEFEEVDRQAEVKKVSPELKATKERVDAETKKLEAAAAQKPAAPEPLQTPKTPRRSFIDSYGIDIEIRDFVGSASSKAMPQSSKGSSGSLESIGGIKKGRFGFPFEINHDSESVDDKLEGVGTIGNTKAGITNLMFGIEYSGKIGEHIFGIGPVLGSFSRHSDIVDGIIGIDKKDSATGLGVLLRYNPNKTKWLNAEILYRLAAMKGDSKTIINIPGVDSSTVESDFERQTNLLRLRYSMPFGVSFRAELQSILEKEGKDDTEYATASLEAQYSRPIGHGFSLGGFTGFKTTKGKVNDTDVSRRQFYAGGALGYKKPPIQRRVPSANPKGKGTRK